MSGPVKRPAVFAALLLNVTILGLPSQLLAQTKTVQGAATMSDAQIESNVLRALASAPELSAQNIQSSSVYGTVTLSGTVHDETLRTRAENLVARAEGVKKVVDELTLGDTPAQAEGDNQNAQAGAQGGSVLQSDGSFAPDPASGAVQGAPAGPPPQPGNPPAYAGSQGGDSSAANPAYQGTSGDPAYQGAPAAPNQGFPPPGQPANGNPPAYGPGGQPGYNQRANNGYPQGSYGQPPYGDNRGNGQIAGMPVTVPSGATFQVRIDRGIDSNHIQPGTPFTGTILNDIAAGGFVAVPRGASVQGTVVDAKQAGTFKGEGALALQLTSVTLGGQTFPVNTLVWERAGRDKTLGTVNTALGLGALGAVFGGLAGGGAGAAIGAGVGGALGVGAAAASPGGRVIVPPESVLTFSLAQPLPLRTVSQGEMQRLAYAAGQGQGPGQVVVRRRYYGPYGPYPPYGYPYGAYYYGR